VGALANSVP